MSRILQVDSFSFMGSCYKPATKRYGINQESGISTLSTREAVVEEEIANGNWNLTSNQILT